MTDTGAALAIEIRIADRCKLIFTKDQVQLLEVESHLSQSQLQNERDVLRQDLNAFQQRLADVNQVSVPNVCEALRRLHLRGRQFLDRLFDDDDKLAKAVEICRQACGPTWGIPGWSPNALAPRVIEVRTLVEHGIPLDILPLLDNKKPQRLGELEDIASVCSTLLGFSAVVKRTLIDAQPARSDYKVGNEPHLRIKMFRDSNLPGAKNAEAFFRKHRESFALKGPWPKNREPGDEDKFCETLAGFLWDPESNFEGESQGGLDQLYYFYCHCDTSSTNPEQHVLYFNHSERGRNREVRLLYLEDALRELRNKDRLDQKPRPLVFLNACASADANPSAAISFPKLFLKKNLGFLGFIGTEATISDPFGQTFAEVFYRYFLGHALPLGQALHAARWYMLRKYKNPLGILYTLYAAPEIQVRNPVPDLQISENAFKTPKTDANWLRRLVSSM